MSHLHQVFLFLAVLNAATHIAAINLRHSVGTALLDSDSVFKIPLKKRVIEATEIDQFHQFVSLRTRELKQGQLSKFESQVESDMVTLSDATSSSSSSVKRIGLSSYKNTQYTGLISVGNSNDEFEVIFDTGKYCFS